MQEDKTNQSIIKPLLSPDEDEELAKGQALYEMDKSNPGWQIVKEWLNDLAYHSWVDPREVKDKGQWEWQELNAFHAANVAKEIMYQIAQAVSRGDYLDKVKHGEVDRRKMKL